MTSVHWVGGQRLHREEISINCTETRENRNPAAKLRGMEAK